MSIADYREARQLGQREYRSRVSRGQFPYPPVLNDILTVSETQGEESLGLVSIPMDHIVGTKTAGRKNAFAANFMPLLEEGSEFAHKWAELADAHVNEGIRDPIAAYEYLNRFYVQEGNKRVSVMKFCGAVAIPGMVRRILPKEQDTLEYKIYAAFLEFYRHTKINYIWFSQPGRFKTLLTAVNGADAPWTDGGRAAFSRAYTRFRKIFKGMGGDKLPGTTADALLAYLKLHDMGKLQEETEAQLKAGLAKCWGELAAYSIPQPVELELDPDQEVTARTLISKILTPKPDTIKALFVYERSPDASAWTHAHDEGRRWAEDALCGRVSTAVRANVAPNRGEKAILRGVEEGADVVFTASPKLLPACVKAAAKCPGARILNCSVYAPHPSIRTYYGRMFEVKFLAGLIAGAMTHVHRVGYIADYPIYGATAALNAFALGVRMTDPWAQVFVEWRARREEGLWESLTAHGVDMISGQDARSPVDPWRAYGLYQLTGTVGKQVAAAEWNWGRYYQRILKSILDGEWKPGQDRESPRAINYWWGLSAGVVDLHNTEDVPRSTLRLADVFRREIVDGRFQPFEGRLVAQGGEVVQESGCLSAEQIVKMDWLAENVVGSIPSIGELSDEARELVRLQGVRTQDKEEAV